MTNEQINTIYHYTDWKAFEDIVVNKKIRLNNVSLSNDSKELTEGLKKYLYNELWNIFVKSNTKYSSDSSLKNIDFADEYVARNPLFAFCFTKNKDDVAQWDRYSNKGLGVCIGFNENIIKAIFKFPFAYGKMRYELNNEQKLNIKDLKNTLEKFNNININVTDNKKLNEAIKLTLNELYEYSIFYKNASFYPENEYRLCITKNYIDKIDNIKDLSEDEKKLYKCKIKYLSTYEKIREYIEYDLKELCYFFNKKYEDLITEIIIGPKSIMNKEFVKRYLESEGLKKLTKKVKKSKSSLR